MNGDKRIFNASGRGILAGLAASAVLGAFAGLIVFLSLMNIDPVDQFEDHVLGQFIEFPVFVDGAEETVRI